MKPFDIIVMGGGMTGLAAAAFAAQQGFSVALVEKQSLNIKRSAKVLGQYSSRVSAITACSQQFLRHLGVWQDILAQRYSAYQVMTVWDGLGTGHIHFDAKDVGAEALGHIVENDVIVQALLVLLQNLEISLYSGVHAENLMVCADYAQVQLASGEQLKGLLVVGADGAQSWVRKQLAWSTRSHDYKQHALVATVKTEHSHEKTAWQRFLPTGPLAFLPLDDVHYSSIVWSIDKHCVNRVLDLDDHGFKQELEHAFEMRLGKIIEVSPRFSFPLLAEHACAYARPRVALVGDAAHRIHPLAGQGVNLGFLDVMALVDVIIQMRQKRRDIGHMMTLQKYERLRYGHNMLTSSVMTGFKELFSIRAKPVVWLRSMGLQFTNQTDFLKRMLAKQAMGSSQAVLSKAQFSSLEQV